MFTQTQKSATHDSQTQTNDFSIEEINCGKNLITNNFKTSTKTVLPIKEHFYSPVLQKKQHGINFVNKKLNYEMDNKDLSDYFKNSIDSHSSKYQSKLF